MVSVKVKICGLTSVAEAEHAAHSGADAIGLVFYRKSPRWVGDLQLARAMCLAVGPFVSTVGLFVDASRDEISAVLEQVPLSLLQFHGNESREQCEQFKRPYIKALRMRPDEPVKELVNQYPSAQGILLDTYVPGIPGGTGQAFQWSDIPADLSKPLVLAGGLKPDNIQDAINQVNPWAVDVSGGVESAPGKKDPALVREFIQLAKSSTNRSAAGE